MTQNGKGDNRRPSFVPYKTWSNNWERIFGKKNKVALTSDDMILKSDGTFISIQELTSNDNILTIKKNENKTN